MHERYHDRLLTSIAAFTRNRDNAEDITATAFASAFENFHRFRGESTFYTWLYAIASNEAKRQWRQACTLSPIDMLSSKILSEPDLFVRALEHEDCRSRLREVLRRLPQPYRRTLISHFIRGHSIKQIARKDRVPVGTVLSRIFTGKRILRNAWGGLNGRD